MKKSFLFAAAIALIGMASCSTSKTETTETENAPEAKAEVADPAPAADVIDLADDNMFRPDTKVTEPTVLDFNATWCVPCKKLAPAFHKAAPDFAGKAVFYSVDIDKNPETAKAFGIQGVPTVIILSPKGTMAKYVGLGDFATEADLRNPDLTPDQLTDIIYGNMVKLIEKAQ